LTETHRLPNGEWTLTPGEKLRRSREIKLVNEGKISGSAQFMVSINPQEVESVDFESGDENLRPLESKLEKAHYPFEFPPDSDSTLVIRVDVECRSSSVCSATPLPPTPMRPPSLMATER